MLNKGEEALPYEPPISSVSKVTEIRPENKNVFLELNQGGFGDGSGFSLLFNEDGSVHASGTATWWTPIVLAANYTGPIPSDEYVITYSIDSIGERSKLPVIDVLCYNENGEMLSFWLENPDEQSILPYGSWTIQMEFIYAEGDYFDCVFRPKILSTRELPSLPIPPEVQSLPAYGMSQYDTYNSIKWTDSGDAMYIQLVDENGGILETPIETNVSEYFAWSNLIDTTGVGAINIITDTGEPVPSTIIFQKRGA